MSAEEHPKMSPPAEGLEKVESDFVQQEIHKVIHSISHELHAPVRSIINFRDVERKDYPIRRRYFVLLQGEPQGA